MNTLRDPKTGRTLKIHGEGNFSKPEYTSWQGMRARCYCKSHGGYERYGGRGILVCDRWMEPIKGYSNFLEDMGRKPTKEHSIDRIDVDGNYEPSNCRWATKSEQQYNRRPYKRKKYELV